MAQPRRADLLDSMMRADGEGGVSAGWGCWVRVERVAKRERERENLKRVTTDIFSALIHWALLVQSSSYSLFLFHTSSPLFAYSFSLFSCAYPFPFPLSFSRVSPSPFSFSFSCPCSCTQCPLFLEPGLGVVKWKGCECLFDNAAFGTTVRLSCQVTALVGLNLTWLVWARVD